MTATDTKSSGVFQRTEKKYLLTENKVDLLLNRISPYVMDSPYKTETLCNVYYDTSNDLLIRRSIDKPMYKEKMRLRSYGIPRNIDPVYLEIKKKLEGVVYKRRIALPLQEAVRYLNYGIRPPYGSQILEEFDYFLSFYHPIPKLFLAYERTAYESKTQDGLRITIDRNIRSRRIQLRLDDTDQGKPLLQQEQCLMEIKAIQNLPLWLVHALSDLEVYPTSFSKYGSVYSKEIQDQKQTFNHQKKERILCSTAS